MWLSNTCDSDLKVCHLMPTHIGQRDLLYVCRAATINQSRDGCSVDLQPLRSSVIGFLGRKEKSELSDYSFLKVQYVKKLASSFKFLQMGGSVTPSNC